MINANNPDIRVLMTSGQYTGDGNDNRNINIGYDLTNRHALVFVKSATGSYAAPWRGYYHVGDVSSWFQNIADGSDLIQNLNNQGFQVGTQVSVNQNGVVYRYIAFWLFH